MGRVYFTIDGDRGEGVERIQFMKEGRLEEYI